MVLSTKEDITSVISSLNQSGDEGDNIEDFLGSINTVTIDKDSGAHFKFKDMFRKLLCVLQRKLQEDRIFTFTG